MVKKRGEEKKIGWKHIIIVEERYERPNMRGTVGGNMQ